MTAQKQELICKVLTDENWPDLVDLFGPNGADSGCWCMYFREKGDIFYANRGEKTKQDFHEVVKSGQPVGLLAYQAGRAVGWCAISPRENYPRIEFSQSLHPIDNQPVWAISCFFIASGARRMGVTRFLIEQALDYARHNEVKIVEAYPVDPGSNQIEDGDGYTGILQVFLKLGFIEVARRNPSNPIVRYQII
jgi:GNAT superfamily N-acetyltransferase